MEEFKTIAADILAIPAVRALLWIAGSLLVGKLTDILLCRALKRIARRTSTNLDEQLIDQLHRPIFITVLLIGLYLSLLEFDLEQTYRVMIASLIQTVGVVVWVGAATRITTIGVEGLYRLSGRVAWIEPAAIPLFSNLFKLLIFSAAIYGLLLAWKLDLAPWLASAGVAGIAIGFAAKDTLANLFGGLFIIIDRPYSIGDYINLGSGERGKVTQIGLRSTRLLTRDDIEVTVPNAQIANSTIVNESGGPNVKTRVQIYVGVAYGSDVNRVREVLLQAAQSVEYALDDPAPRIRFNELGDSALIFRVLCWIEEPELRGRCIDELNGAVYDALDEAGINIPFPQRELHLRQPLASASA